MSPAAPSTDAPRVTILAALLLLGPAFSGCLGGDGAGSGTAAFYVKDAPSDTFSHVNVTFTKVSVHAAGGDEADGNETDGEDEGNETEEDDGSGGAPDSSGEGWVTVFEGQRTVDLLDYNASEARALLGVGELEPGTYNQVVIHVSSAHGIHADDGSKEEFTVTTGWVKLNQPWTVKENATTHVTADIDLDRSIVKMGPNGYRLNPVVGKVIVDQDDSSPESRSDDEMDDEDEADDSGSADEGAGSGNGSEEAQTSMYVKDAPTDEFDEIWLQFDEVEVHLAGDGADEEEPEDNASDEEDAEEPEGNDTEENETEEPEGNETEANETEEPEGNETEANDPEENETEEDDGRWITAVDTSREIDLLRFSDPDAKAFLGNASLPEGKYTQIRVNVTDAWGVQGNETENITVASETAKVNKPWRLEANGTVAQVTIDLDLDRSLKERGGGQGWLMTPVVGSVVMDWVPEDPGQDRPDDADENETDDGNETADGEEGPDGDKDASGPEDEQGNATAYVKDAPTDEFDGIWVSFDEIRVHAAGDDNETEDDNATADNGTEENDTEEDGEWLTLFDGSRSVNLLNYSENASKAFLGDAELDVGRYTQIRVNVTDAWGTLNDTGERENITVSSESAKVVRSFEVTANDTTQVVIDLDLDQSLTEQGHGQWRMTPVVGQVLVDHVEEDPRADQSDGES